MAFASAMSCSGLTGRPTAVARALPAAGRVNRLAARATTLPTEVKTVAPIGKRVLVKVEETEKKSSGGILLPSSAQKKPTTGKIVDSGTATTVKTGDRILYSKYAGTEIELQRENFIILKEEDVIGLAPSDDVAAISPLSDRVLVRVAEAAAETAGGLILTESAKEVPTVGTVVAVGPGKEPEEGASAAGASKKKGGAKKKEAEAAAEEEGPALKAGDAVLYQKYSGTELSNPDGTKFILVRTKDILAVVA